MPHQQYDVAGLGNAIVDVIASVDDRFLLTHRIAKGGMTLIDEFRAKELLKVLADNRQTIFSNHVIKHFNDGRIGLSSSHWALVIR